MWVTIISPPLIIKELVLNVYPPFFSAIINQIMKNKIRPYYQELQGYLSQTPLPKESYTTVASSQSWDQVNSTIDALNELTGKDYSRFKITPEPSHAPGSSGFVRVVVFRQKLGGLINTLHAEYFGEEVKPFSGSPSTVISQQQSQEQNVDISMILQVQERIVKRLESDTIEPEEKKFLESIKDKLAGIKTWLEFLNLILSTAKATGLSMDKLEAIFR